MKRLQRIVLWVAAIGIFHSSLVPPVKQDGDDLCRYHEFMERGWPFTREFGATGVDGIALLTEYGIILSLTALVYQAAGSFVRD
jgi:hypothetical protein